MRESVREETHLPRVEILTASCCAREDVADRIESVLIGLKGEIPELEWKVSDIAEESELIFKYKVPVTPAIVINGNLEFAGFPNRAALETRIRQYYRQ